MEEKRLILEEEWNKGSEINRKRLARFQMLCETYASNCIDNAIKRLFSKMLDPETISKYGKTHDERMAINTYLRCFKDIHGG